MNTRNGGVTFLDHQPLDSVQDSVARTRGRLAVPCHCHRSRAYPRVQVAPFLSPRARLVQLYKQSGDHDVG